MWGKYIQNNKIYLPWIIYESHYFQKIITLGQLDQPTNQPVDIAIFVDVSICNTLHTPFLKVGWLFAQFLFYSPT